jgi:hypothetical protein
MRMKLSLFQKLVKLTRRECLVGVLIMEGSARRCERAAPLHPPARTRARPRRIRLAARVKHDASAPNLDALALLPGEDAEAGADFTDRLLSIAGGFAGSPQMSARGRGCGHVRQSLCSSVSKASCRSDRAASLRPGGAATGRRPQVWDFVRTFPVPVVLPMADPVDGPVIVSGTASDDGLTPTDAVCCRTRSSGKNCLSWCSSTRTQRADPEP